MSVCVCTGVGQNTGIPSSRQAIAAVTKKLILVPLLDSDGNRNGIDLVNDTLDQSYFDALFNQADATKRWFPTPDFDNVEDVPGDPLTQGLNSGANVIATKGIRTYTGLMLNNSPVLLGKFEAFGCFKFGVYAVDICGNLVGDISSDGNFLYPTPVNEKSFYPRYDKASDTTVADVRIDFEYSHLALDKNIRMIKASELGGADLLLAIGLLDVNVEVISCSTTALVVDLTTDFGSLLSPIATALWLLAEFTLYNNTTPGAVTITGVTNVGYRYTLSYGALTVADELTLSGSKSGYDFPDTDATVA